MVDIRPSTMVNLSLITFARGARQLVVHEALLCVRVCVCVCVHSHFYTTQRSHHTHNMYIERTVHPYRRRLFIRGKRAVAQSYLVVTNLSSDIVPTAKINIDLTPAHSERTTLTNKS